MQHASKPGDEVDIENVVPGPWHQHEPLKSRYRRTDPHTHIHKAMISLPVVGLRCKQLPRSRGWSAFNLDDHDIAQRKGGHDLEQRLRLIRHGDHDAGLEFGARAPHAQRQHCRFTAA